MRKFSYLKIKVLLLIVVGLNFSTLTFAETIILKSGQKIEGKIIEKTNEYIKIDFYGASLTYFLDEIESIDGIKLVKFLEKSDTQSVITSDRVYTNDNYGFSLIIPEGWFVVSGEQKRQEIKEKMDREISYDKFVEKMQEKSGDKICPLPQSPEAIEKLFEPLKQSVLRMCPVVTFYKFNPDSAPKDVSNPFIQIMVSDAQEDDTLENMKFNYEILKRFVPNVKFIEEPHEVVVDGVGAVRAIYQGNGDRFTFCGIHLVKNDQRYDFRFVTDVQTFREYMPDFEKTLSSFKVKSKK